jgi:cytochrome b561
MTETILPHDVPNAKADPAANYSLLSVINHWLGVLAIIIMVATQQLDLPSIHLSFGLLLALPLIWRVVFRLSRGFPRTPNQHPTISLLERLIIIGLLAAIFLLAITGLLMPLLSGTAYNFFNLVSWTASYSGNQAVLEMTQQVHLFCATALLPLFLLHLASFARHAIINKNGNTLRMLKPLNGGK